MIGTRHRRGRRTRKASIHSLGVITRCTVITVASFECNWLQVVLPCRRLPKKGLAPPGGVAMSLTPTITRR